MAWLDWRQHEIGKRPGKCRICGQPALMWDEDGKPCHKVCAETEADRKTAAAAAAYAREG